MKQLLLPFRFKKIGWALLVPATVLGIAELVSKHGLFGYMASVPALLTSELNGPYQFFTSATTDVFANGIACLFLLGAFFIIFSKEKTEDEYVRSLRQSALLWAVFINNIVLLFCFAFIYGMAFFNVMLINLFTIPIIYILRFYFVRYSVLRSLKHEE